MTDLQARALLRQRGIDTSTFSDNVVRILARNVLGVHIDAVRTDATPAPTAHDRFRAQMANEATTSGIHIPGGAVGRVAGPGVVEGTPVVPSSSGHAATRTPIFVSPSIESGVHGRDGRQINSIAPGSLATERE